jgi:hypothetical protein
MSLLWMRKVNRDGHVEVAKAYYSLPPEYLGRTVWVRWDARLVRIFNHRFEQVALQVKVARFRELKALDDFDFSFNPSIKKKQIYDLATCRFVHENRDVLLLGPPKERMRIQKPPFRPPARRAKRRQNPTAVKKKLPRKSRDPLVNCVRISEDQETLISAALIPPATGCF